jgi:tetratricopeptide (TPR) repeat protein
MSEPKQAEPISDVDTALLDAELFVKYHAPERAIKRLRTALDRSPRSIPLRERLREIAASHKHADEAARQALALASLYIEREEYDTAHDRLLEAKQLDPRINIATGLEAIRRARRPDLRPAAQPSDTRSEPMHFTLAGDLAAISVFDAIQVIENARLTGALTLVAGAQGGQVLFNEGAIVDAECAGEKAEAAFQRIVEITSGRFEFQQSEGTYPVEIQAASNTNLMLDTLRHLDETKQ